MYVFLSYWFLLFLFFSFLILSFLFSLFLFHFSFVLFILYFVIHEDWHMPWQDDLHYKLFNIPPLWTPRTSMESSSQKYHYFKTEFNTGSRGEVRWGEVRWREVKWDEVRWGEARVRWGEVRWGSSACKKQVSDYLKIWTVGDAVTLVLKSWLASDLLSLSYAYLRLVHVSTTQCWYINRYL